MNINVQNKIIKKLKKFYKKKKIYLHEPSFDSSDIYHLNKCLKSTMVSTAGEYVRKFESEIEKFTNTKNAIVVLNGTVGIELCLKVLGVKQNEEVILPCLTFVAPASAIVNVGAIPHFATINKSDLGINTFELESYLSKICVIKKGKCFNKKTKRFISAIVPVHVFGHSCNITEIIRISKKFNLKVVEDAADALGTYFKNKHVGTFSKLGVLSFNGNKTITTGCGGAILTNDTITAKKIRHLISTAKVGHNYLYIHDKFGFNYRLPAINSSIGYSQMLKIKNILNKKRKLFLSYKNLFKEYKEIAILEAPKNSKSNFWLQTIILKKDNPKKIRNRFLKELNKQGIMARAAWTLIPDLNPYKIFPKMLLKRSRKISESLINIPSSFYK